MNIELNDLIEWIAGVEHWMGGLKYCILNDFPLTIKYLLLFKPQQGWIVVRGQRLSGKLEQPPSELVWASVIFEGAFTYKSYDPGCPKILVENVALTAREFQTCWMNRCLVVEERPYFNLPHWEKDCSKPLCAFPT